ncbi:MAG: tetratricopeptide repeat protein [Pyrinomonadaceae bacterium]
MQHSSFFLRTKLLPPRAASDTLKRPRLTERLRSNEDAPVTLIAADAGYGKTTLIADFLRDQSRPFVWYQLDHTDADPIVFLNYVAQGIRGIEEGFGDALLAYLAEANEDLVRSPERAADLLINEILMAIEQPFVLVLDDYHHIGEDTPVHKIVDRILQYASEHLHLVITTRDLPPLAIMRRRTQARALVITRDDLLFNDDEVRELFRSTLNVELKEDELSEYRHRTHGWITALQLVRQIAEREIGTNGNGKNVRPDLTEILKRSERDIFDYFAEEVFSREDEATRELLLHLSLLESLPLHHCSLIFPEFRCSHALPEIAQKNVFLTVAGEKGSGEEYRFHPLFRDFLLRRMRSEIGHTGLIEQRNRIAELFLKDEQWENAVQFMIAAGSYDRAAETIADRGPEWIKAGAVISFAAFAEKVPDESLDKYPWSLLHIAEVARLQGETERSMSVLNRAVRLFAEQKDSVGEAEALHSLASTARRRNRPSEALKLLEKAEQLVSPDSETYLKCLNTRGLCLILEGNWNEAEQQFRAALELAERLSNEHYIRLTAHNLALAPGFRGDFGEALKWFSRIFRDGRSGRPLPQEAIGHLNVARLHLFRGELDKAETNLEKALELAQTFNLRSLLPEILEAYADYYRERGDAPHAVEFYERSLQAYNDAGVDLATRELNEARASFALDRGDTVKARALWESLVDSRKKLKNELVINTARLGVCRVDLADGKTDKLDKRVKDLLGFFNKQNHYYDEANAALVLAEVYQKQDKPKEMVEAVMRLLDLAARYDYDYWLKKAIRRAPAVFEYEDIYERLPTDLKEELAAAKDIRLVPAATPALVAEEQANLTDLTIKVLGPVEIFRDPTMPFASDAWTTRRARDIFCYIATRKHRRVPKDTLIEAFWGEEDPAVIEKNFHPTISHIRKALNSNQPLKQNFIVFRDGAYQLNPQFTYLIDTEQFTEAVQQAENAKKDSDDDALRIFLERAHQLYRGPFLEGSYDDWAEEQRHFYEEQWARVLNGLARQAVADKQWNAALKYSAEILALDPYREDLHRLTLRVLAAQGKPAAVKKHYDDMQKLLKTELGIAPSAETAKLYKELMK